MVWPLAAGGSAQRLAATRRPFRGKWYVWVAKTIPHIVNVVYSTIYQRTFNIFKDYIYVCEPLLVLHIFYTVLWPLIPCSLATLGKRFLVLCFLQVVATSLGCKASSNPKPKIKEMCFTFWVRRCYRNFQFQKDVVPMYQSPKICSTNIWLFDHGFCYIMISLKAFKPFLMNVLLWA